jgi:hypothetical protein
MRRGVMAGLELASILDRRSFASTSLSIILFFWILAFVRLSSEVAIFCACSALASAVAA